MGYSVFYPYVPQKGAPCGVILSVFIISATSEASLYGVFDWSIFITANLRLVVRIILSTTHMAL